MKSCLYIKGKNGQHKNILRHPFVCEIACISGSAKLTVEAGGSTHYRTAVGPGWSPGATFFDTTRRPKSVVSLNLTPSRSRAGLSEPD